MTGNFLYGASCQGIQAFIFETDELQEIVGGSELVEQLCTSCFEDFLFAQGINKANYTQIIGAAGNIRYFFQNREDVEKVVLEFPKHAIAFAPGITVSQAVQKISDDIIKSDMDILEKNIKAQRNRAWRPADLGFQAVERCRRTARPAIKREKGESLDKGLMVKRPAGKEDAPQSLLKKLIPERLLKNSENHIPFKMEEMINSHKSEWLAVIHADGNNLGEMIQGMAEKLRENSKGKVADVYEEFSMRLEEATQCAAQHAFGTVILEKDYITHNRKMPIRPIIIGGDDLTVICRADLAIDFTTAFLQQFQVETRIKLKNLVDVFELEQFATGLTACAGIAFVKPKYPFHYAAGLAEELCGAAKKASKDCVRESDLDIVPASLAFFKVRSSFLDSYGDLCRRELTAGATNLNYGPYALEDGIGMPTVSKLKKCVKLLQKKDAPVAALRKWLSALERDQNEAEQLMKRVKQITNKKFWKEEGLDLNNAIQGNKTPVADWLSIVSLSTGARS
jgi:hypothetical protein